MRLTKTDKEAFVNAVMDDVPYTDYDKIAHEEIRKLAFSVLPEELKPLVKKHKNEYFVSRVVYTPSGIGSLYVIGDPSFCKHVIRDKYPALWAELIAMGANAKAQSEARNELRVKVAAMIAPCSTLKSAKAKLPEFEKYLPAERNPAPTAGVPACNVIADLTNAGWPKEKK